jgi:hypothetical protein
MTSSLNLAKKLSAQEFSPGDAGLEKDAVPPASRMVF